MGATLHTTFASLSDWPFTWKDSLYGTPLGNIRAGLELHDHVRFTEDFRRPRATLGRVVHHFLVQRLVGLDQEGHGNRAADELDVIDIQLPGDELLVEGHGIADGDRPAQRLQLVPSGSSSAPLQVRKGGVSSR